MNIDYSQEAPAVAGRLTLAQIEELVATLVALPLNGGHQVIHVVKTLRKDSPSSVTLSFEPSI